MIGRLSVGLFLALVAIPAAALIPGHDVTEFELDAYGIYTTADPTCQTGLTATRALSSTSEPIELRDVLRLGAFGGPIARATSSDYCVVLIVRNEVAYSWQSGTYGGSTNGESDSSCDAGGTDSMPLCSTGALAWPTALASAYVTAFSSSAPSTCSGSTSAVVPLYFSTWSDCTAVPGVSCGAGSPPPIPNAHVPPSMAADTSAGLTLPPLERALPVARLHFEPSIGGGAGSTCGVQGATQALSPETFRCMPNEALGTVLFTHHPMDPSDIEELTPLGKTVAYAGQIRPKHKQYLYPVQSEDIEDCDDLLEVFAMGDGIIEAVASQGGNYIIRFRMSCDLTVEFQNIVSLNAPPGSALLSAIRQSTGNPSWVDGDPLPWGDGIDVYVTGGTLVGWIHRGRTGQMPGMDGGMVEMCFTGELPINVVDSRRIPGSYVNGSSTRYSEWGTFGRDSIHVNATSFTDYMSPGNRATWTALLPGAQTSHGQVAWDVPGTLQGTWFEASFAEGASYDGGTVPDGGFPPPVGEAAALSFVPSAMPPVGWTPDGGTYDVVWGNWAPTSALDYSGWAPCTEPDAGYADELACAERRERHADLPTSGGHYWWVREPGTTAPELDPDPITVHGTTGTQDVVCYDLPSNGFWNDYDALLVQAPNIAPDAPSVKHEEIRVKYMPHLGPTPMCSTLLAGNPTPDATWATYHRSREDTSDQLVPPVDLSYVAKIFPPGQLDSRRGFTRPSTEINLDFEPCSGCSRDVKSPADARILFIAVMKEGGTPFYVVFTGMQPISEWGPFRLAAWFIGLSELDAAIVDALEDLDLEQNAWYSLADGSITNWTTVDAASDGLWMLPLHHLPEGSQIDLAQSDVIGVVTEDPLADYFGLTLALMDVTRSNGTFVNASTYRYGRFMDELLGMVGASGLAHSPFGDLDLPTQFADYNWHLYAQCIEDYFEGPDAADWTALYPTHGGETTPVRCISGGVDRPGSLVGTWFNPLVEAGATTDLDADLAALTVIPSPQRDAGAVDIGWGFVQASSGGNSGLALLDPMNWTACTQIGGETVTQANTRCLDEGKRPIGYSGAPIHFLAESTGSTTINPAPWVLNGSHSTKIVCYDLRGMDHENPPWHDYVFFYLESEHVLKVKYMPARAESPQCENATFPATNDPTWVTYVR